MTVDSNQLLYVFPITKFLFYKSFLQFKRKMPRKTSALFFLYGMIFIFVILTQQIPKDWFPLYKGTGVAYITLLLISYQLTKPHNLKDLFYLSHRESEL
jgi:hypothetical protein